MNKKKLKKLINNPKKFISDSAIFKKVIPQNTVTAISIAFIIIGDDEDLIKLTVDSIGLSSSKKSGVIEKRFVSINSVLNSNSQYGDIFDAVDSTSSEYIKIMHEGDTISSDFINNLCMHNINPGTIDLIVTPYTNDIQSKNIDPMFSAIQPKAITGNIENSKLTVLPLFSCLIFNRGLFGYNEKTNEDKLLFDELNICMTLLSQTEEQNNNYYYVGNALTSHHLGGRLHELFMAASMSAPLILNCIRVISELNNSNTSSQFIQRNGFYFVHCFVLSYLKNKKPDELLTSLEKDEIYIAIIILINSYGTNVIKSFSSSNYNHVHKIGYLSLLNEKAPFDLCYPEDIDANQVKFKLVSQENVLPLIKRNSKEVIANHIKTKIYSIFDNDFSYETYLWLAYQNSSDTFVINTESQTSPKIEFLVSGKRFPTVTVKQLENALSRKNRVVTQNLPLKVKILRHLSNNIVIRKKYANNWLFIDNDLRADDNAEHFYRYVFNNKKNINSYFLLSKKSNDWQRLKNEGFKLIPFGGLRHRLALINSDMILSSHANPAITNYLPRKHFADIFKHKFVFLQHGITKDDQSEWLNSRNISHLVTAAYPEFSDISSDGRYKYTSKETILSGFPRYDALFGKSTDSKIILIMPTWRKSLTGEFIGKTSKRAKNPDFTTSLFCKMWGGLLASDDLKALVEHHGYKVMYYPHPNLIDYQDDLGIPDYIEIADTTKQSIQDIFRKTSVLITDFSSVAFDVSYMNKAILYFQFDSDSFFSEHSYSKGYYDYEQHGFGPVVDNIPGTISQLSMILEHECIPTEQYQKRISDFFPFNDNKNSERLLNALTRKNSSAVNFGAIERKVHHLASKFDIQKLVDIISLNIDKISSPENYQLTIFRKLVISSYVISIAMKSHELSSMMLKIAKDSDIDGCYKLISNNEKIIESSLDSFFDGSKNLLFSCDIFNKLDIYPEVIDILSKLSLALHDYNNGDAALCLSRVYSINNITDMTLPRDAEIIIIKSLFLNGDIKKATERSKNITFDEIEKSDICSLLETSVVDFNSKLIKAFLSDKLNPTILSSDKHIEFILAHGSINAIDYEEFINHSRLPAVIINSYIRQTYIKKQFLTINILISENKVVELISRDDQNITYRLFSEFNVNGIDSFLSSLLSLSELTGFEESMERLVVKNAHIDLSTFYKIIEQTIAQYSELLSCAYLYKMSLLFHKNNKPVLAKKLISQYLMVQHEIFYSQPRNWDSENDYHILINAANELNKIAEV